MKKLTIQNISILVNKEKINIISLENKTDKYILYSNTNINHELIEMNNFTKMEFNEDMQITPKKKFNDLKLNIIFNDTTKLYTLLYNGNFVYFLNNPKNIIINNSLLKIILIDGSLFNNTDLKINSNKNIVNDILNKNDTLENNKSNLDIFKINISPNKELNIDTTNDKNNKFIELKTEVIINPNIEYNIKPKEESKVEINIEPKVELNLETKVEPDVKTKVEPKVQTKIDPKVETKVDSKVETKVESKIETKVEYKVETNVEPKIETKVDSKVQTKVEPKVETKVEPKVETKIEPKVETKIEPKIEPKVEPKVETKVEIKVEPNAQTKIELENNKIYTINEELKLKKNIFMDIVKDVDNEKYIKEKIIDINMDINNEKKDLNNKKLQLETNIFNIDNILEDFNNLFHIIGNNSKSVTENLNNKDQNKQNKQHTPQYKQNKEDIPLNKLYISKINYQNIFYNLYTIKLTETIDLNFSNLYKTNIIDNNIIHKFNLCFELEKKNSSYLIIFINQKYLINKINNTIVITNLINKSSQILKNKDIFKIGIYDFILYNECTLLVPMINKKIYDNNYGTSYNAYIPRI